MMMREILSSVLPSTPLSSQEKSNEQTTTTTTTTTITPLRKDLKTYDLQDFKFGKTLGAGGFATVYEVWERAQFSSVDDPLSSASKPQHRRVLSSSSTGSSSSSSSSSSARLAAVSPTTSHQDDNNEAEDNDDDNECNNKVDDDSCGSDSSSDRDENDAYSRRSSTTQQLPQLDSISVTSSSASSARSSSGSSAVLAISNACKQHTSRKTLSSLALKRLNIKTLTCAKKTRMGIQGLRNEAKLLSRLPRHDHIITLYGTSASVSPLIASNINATSCSRSKAASSFLVMERLVQPLDKVLKFWQLEQEEQQQKQQKQAATKKSSKSLLKKSLKKIQLATSAKKKRQWRHQKAVQAEQERLEQWSIQSQRLELVGLPVAKALQFLHQHLILFRDLKPANVGFDCHNQVKLFDFGLARQLKSDDTIVKGRNGTLRYMAPEVANANLTCHGFSSDVYSFGMFLYEVLTLEKPYSNVTDKYELTRLVSIPSDTQADSLVHNKYRPNLAKVASPEMQDLLRACWREPLSRPSMKTIVQQLQTELERYHQHEQEGEVKDCNAQDEENGDGSQSLSC